LDKREKQWKNKTKRWRDKDWRRRIDNKVGSIGKITSTFSSQKMQVNAALLGDLLCIYVTL
jgi:hypothetical protein